MIITKKRQEWLGIDFSGNHAMWTPGRMHSNVWIATIVQINCGKFSVDNLRRVQKLPGSDAPFKRLMALLKDDSKYRAAGIDAPFSVPKSVQQNNHGTLLRLIGQIDCHGRPFLRAQDFLAEFKGVDLPWGRHEYRETESHWRKKGMNVRSTLWGGPRGGAPMTSACLTLLNQAGCSVWPFSTALDEPLLVEAFPAAQLKTWGLPHQKYNGSTPEAVLNREKILKELDARVEFGDYRKVMAENADALDAVLAAFAAIAVTENQLPEDIPGISAVEGWIAVHR